MFKKALVAAAFLCFGLGQAQADGVAERAAKALQNHEASAELVMSADHYKAMLMESRGMDAAKAERVGKKIAASKSAEAVNSVEAVREQLSAQGFDCSKAKVVKVQTKDGHDASQVKDLKVDLVVTLTDGTSTAYVELSECYLVGGERMVGEGAEVSHSLMTR
ncbi:MAG: hypothetical protein ACYS22_08065 [Planctomycetota bacterium]|jgi:hypothetical protein